MSENKFIKHLKGEDTAKSVLEIKNQRTTTSFANMPAGTSNANDVYSDHRGNATGVLRGTDNWKLSNINALVDATTVYGDGQDLTGSYDVTADSLWVDATYTFATPKIFNPNTKFVLKLCGERLSNSTDTVPFSLIITIGNSIITKSFVVREHAFAFSEEFVVDFAESNATTLKCTTGTTMRVQLLCGATNASATIYNGMTVFTALQRRVDGDVVASDKKTFDEVVQDIDDINDDIDQIHEDIDDLEDYVDDTFLPLTGGTLTGDLAFRYSTSYPVLRIIQSGQNTNHLRFINNSYASQSISFDLSQAAIHPLVTGRGHLGTSNIHFGDAYIDKVYTGVINNGYDIAVPATNGADTLALKSEVDLAANSGRMITDQGVWYAKMDSATVAPAAEDDTNYADFSQVDGQGNPIIVIYERQNGAWVQSETITPPAEYDGYVPITSKIWDITEQAGQQGGRILWNHQSKEFTPYPQIISFEDIEVTGDSTVIMPLTPGTNQIVNKNYVDTLVNNSIGDATITLTQRGQTMGSFTTNQSGDATIALDGGSSYHPDLFDWKWADHQVNDVQWLRADTFSWQAGSVYPAAYKHLRNDMYNWYSWANNGTTIYTKKAYPEVGEKAYSDSALTTEVGEITDVTDTLDITVEKITVNGVVYDSVSGSNIAPTTENVGGVTVQYIPAEDGHKIVTDFHESEVADAYAATGVAWYYIIDYGFKRFKLPRGKHNKYTETLGVVGNGRNTVYTDGTNDCVFNPYFGSSNNGIFVDKKAANIGVTVGTAMGTATNITEHAAIGLNTDPTKTNVLTTPIPQDTDQYKYLYFYVGEFTQPAIENTAGLNAELFNEKADNDLDNVLANIDFVIESQLPTAGNNYTWYRKYRSGWVEQGGIYLAPSGTSSITLPVEMAGGAFTYSVQVTAIVTSSNARIVQALDSSTSTTLNIITNNGFNVSWEVKGIAA